MVKVLGLVGQKTGCELWRTFQPFAELQKHGYSAEWGWRDDGRLANIAHLFDAVILQRLYWPPEIRDREDAYFRALHNAGITIIYEIDDDTFTDDFVRRLMTHHKYDREYSEDRRASILRAMRACDGVTCSTQRLATIVRQHTDKPVKVVPNSIDLPWFKLITKQAERKVPGLTIGWAGGNRPDADVLVMAEAWARITKRYPHVTFVIQGHHSQVIYDVVPNERIAMLDWLPIEYYPAGMVNIDIGCCPLAPLPFNRSKSFIKAMEYAAVGAAVVASPLLYNQIIDHGENGYICETVDEWEAALSALVESYDHRKRISKALLAKVRKHHTLQKNVWRWVDAWEDIVSDARQRKRNRILIPKGVDYVAV